MTKMPHSNKWQRRLAESFGSSVAGSLMERAQIYYAEYCAQHSPERKRANRTNLRTRILPGLAIYKALGAEDVGREKALLEVESLFRTAFFTRMMKGIRLLNYFPNPFLIIRPALKLMVGDEYKPGAHEIIDDSADCFAVNVYHCYIFDVLVQHNAEELTVLYCKTDDWLAEALPKISWQRTKTLGRGDDCCDFRWCRIKE